MPVIAYSVKYEAHLERAVLSDTLHSGKAFQENIDSCNFNSKNQFPEAWDKLIALRKKGIKSGADEYGEIYGTGLNELYWFDPANGSKMFNSSVPGFGYNGEVYSAMLGDDPEWKVGGTMRSFEPRKSMAKVQVPMLVCVGRYDRVATPKVSWEIARTYPKGILKVFEKSGHRPWVEETFLAGN
jgi:proline iminopeptidase